MSSPIDSASDGDLQRLAGFSLANFVPTDYTLLLRVTDEVSGETRELKEPFRVLSPER